MKFSLKEKKNMWTDETVDNTSTMLVNIKHVLDNQLVACSSSIRVLLWRKRCEHAHEVAKRKLRYGHGSHCYWLYIRRM
jgi:hypothetical protein